MMRGRHSAAVAVRLPSGGIVLHEEPLDTRLYGHGVVRWPFVRGLVLLWEMLVLGSRMMLFAASVALPAEDGAATEGAPAQPVAAPGVVVESSAPLASDPRLVLTLLVSLTFGLGLFFLLPLGVVGLAHGLLGGGWLSLVVEGVIRLGLLIGYLSLIGRFGEIQRVFAYHGAEHKAINCFETGDPLDVAHVRLASRVHTRCGTGFLLIVVVVSIIVFALIGSPPLPVRLLSRILLVPVIAAIAYELMRLGAANYRYRVVRWLMAPSLALQGLTTREPDASQIECAIASLERVLHRDGVVALHSVV